LQPRVKAISLLLLPKLCKSITVYRSPRLVQGRFFFLSAILLFVIVSFSLVIIVEVEKVVFYFRTSFEEKGRTESMGLLYIEMFRRVCKSHTSIKKKTAPNGEGGNKLPTKNEGPKTLHMHMYFNLEMYATQAYAGLFHRSVYVYGSTFSFK